MNTVSILGDEGIASNPTSRRRLCIRAVLAFGLATVVAIVYWPALRHLPHSDHCNYILDTIDCDNFTDLVGHTYSFARTRIISTGDTQLFRPVLFIWLAALQAFLGLRWEWCQALSIGLHIVACVLLLALLEKVFRRVQPRDADVERENAWAAARSPFTYLPFALTFFFALNYAIVEQVIWYHIQGYLVALILILAAALLLVRVTDGQGSSTGLLVGAWALTLAAAFTYELGQFFAVCASVYLIGTRWAGWRQRLKGGLAFLAIVAVYQGVNQVDRRLNSDTYTDDAPLHAVVEKACDVETLRNFTRYLLYTTVQPFLPGRIFVHSHGKVCLEEMLWTGLSDSPVYVVGATSFEGCSVEPHAWNNQLKLRPSLIVGFVVFAFGATLTLAGAVRLPRRSLTLIGLLAGTGLAQACLIVVGRLNMRPGPITLVYNSHYTYFGLLFSLTVAAVGMAQAQAVRSPPWRRLAHGTAALLVVGLLVLGTGSAFKVHELNVRIAQRFHSSWRWIRSLRNFVHLHEYEPDFRFAVAWNAQERMPQYCQIPVPYLFYRRYIDCDHPKYVLCYRNRKFVGTPLAEWRQNHPDGEPHFCSNFIRLDRFYQTFYREGLYFAVDNRAISPFLACPSPKEESAFPRDTDLQDLLDWIKTRSP